MRSLLTHLNYDRKNFTFFSSGIRINEKNNFRRQKSQKKGFLQKEKSNLDRWCWCSQNISFKERTVWYK